MPNNRDGPSPSFIDHLERPGGHILILLALVVCGCIGSAYKVPSADHIALGSLALLLIVLKGN